MPVPDLIVRSKKTVLPEAVEQAAIWIQGGLITAINPYDEILPGAPLIEIAPDCVTMPGLVDTHVHINEPGRTDWEGFATATRAAAAGGVTTLVDMPLNSIPPTTTLAGLEAKRAAARDKCSVDTAFWGGLVPGNTGELQPLREAGVVGFKCFLVHSGVEEFPNVTEEDLRESLPELARLDSLLIVHAELPGPIERATKEAAGRNDNYQTFLSSRPPAAENQAVELMIRLASEFGVRVHIVHHSSAAALPLLRRAQAEGLRITAETCPHYLAFASEDIPDGATEFKCCPPIRDRENQELLWEALEDATISMIVSDHSPCPPELKLRESGDFLQAWGGISSLQLRLPIVWSLAQARGHTLDKLADWLCAAPARLVGLDQRKGRIAVGCDADFVIWDPEVEFRLEPSVIQHRHKLTPYLGRVLRGVVKKTFLRGREVYDDGAFPDQPQGILL